MKNQLWMLAAVCLLLVAQAERSVGATSSRDRQATAALVKPDEKTISDVYIYLLGRLLMLDQKRADIERGGRSYNRISYEPLKSASEGADKIALHTAWIAVDDRIPVMLELPKIDGRRYSVLIVDEWGSEIANINPQTFPSKPSGMFALVKAGSNVEVPDDAVRIMLHSGKARMLCAIEVTDGPTQVEAIRRFMTIKTLFKPALVQKRAKRPAKVPLLDRQTLISADIFDDVESIIGDALDVAPDAAAMQERARSVACYIGSGAAARGEVAALLPQVVSRFQTYVKAACSNKDAVWFDGHCSCDDTHWCRTARNYSRSIDRSGTAFAR